MRITFLGNAGLFIETSRGTAVSMRRVDAAGVANFSVLVQEAGGYAAGRPRLPGLGRQGGPTDSVGTVP